MHQNSFVIGVLSALMFAGFGAAPLFFTDHILDWQIRMMQSRWYRRTSRALGLLIMLFGLGLAAAIIVKTRLI